MLYCSFKVYTSRIWHNWYCHANLLTVIKTLQNKKSTLLISLKYFQKFNSFDTFLQKSICKRTSKIIFLQQNFKQLAWVAWQKLSENRVLLFLDPQPPALGPRPHLLFYSPRPKLLFHGPHVSKLLFHGPELSKLLFDGPADRKRFLYFCIVKVSNFSIEGRWNI